jgi:phosphoribosylformylglycinamidine synthase
MQIVKSPGLLVIANYAPMTNITCKVTPDLKRHGSYLVFIDMAKGKNRLGGSALAQVYKQVGNDCPDVEDVELLIRAFKTVQDLVEKGLVLSVHDRCHHGGLIVTLLEMAFAGNVGLNINLCSDSPDLNVFFGEEAGLVIECEDMETVLRTLADNNIPSQLIGKTCAEPRGNPDITVFHHGALVLNEKMLVLRQIWEETSSRIDALQANPHCVAEETKVNAALITPPPYRLCFIGDEPFSLAQLQHLENKPKVAILRAEGSNGDREMTSAFYLAGFEPWDVTLSDLVSGRITLDDFRGIAFIGGFANADVFDAGKGWAGVIRFNRHVAEQFRRFYLRPDTFSLGVCNGCQLMALLGWIPWADLPDDQQPRFVRNTSERFESRFSAVKILPSPAIMLKGMEDSILGVWVAHGEGRCHFPDPGILQQVTEQGLAPIRFVNSKGEPTEQYPFNPNCSVSGITALCSPDGRHLALMPHPERCFLRWQWPYWPKEWKTDVSPWLQLFQNAYRWCKQN